LNLPLQRQVEDRTMPERTRTVAQLLGYTDDDDLGITLIGYRPLRELQRRLHVC
jgi:hypothetical protein